MKRALLVFVLFSLCIGAMNADGWIDQGHQHATTLAVTSLDGRLPQFFFKDEFILRSACTDPDDFKNKMVPHSRGTEGPDHYLDLEKLRGAPVPRTRYKLIAFCAERGIKPEHVGFLPYAVTEWTEKLAVSLYEWRNAPDEQREALSYKCLTYAGILAHYSGDLCMPLHTTIHFDGRVGKDGKSPFKGLHLKVDGLIHKVSVVPFDPTDIEPFNHEYLFEEVMAEFMRSHALIDRVYELEQHVPALDQEIKSEELKKFARNRLRAATRFTAELYLTAWKISETLKPPY
ncbi:MAG: hypothetical protein U5N86_09750 [Planctomycetota bacterium]|nr:hypothetical protein [Planctomycetota bacterium]